MTDVNLDYTKNDFLYYKNAYKNGKELYNCANDKIQSGTLKSACENKTSGACSQAFKTNLCNNKKYADQLLSQKINHSGSDELYRNTTAQYNVERLSFVNLGIGIIVSGIFIMKFKQ
jgi:hypothetical protein